MTEIHYNNHRGMTLMEIMIVVIIMAVVAALAVPQYRNTVEHARASEATTNLSIILMGEKLYKTDNGTYLGGLLCPGGANPQTCPAINTPLNVDITAQYYNLTVGAATKVAFTATAARRGGTKVYTIDQTGTVTSVGAF